MSPTYLGTNYPRGYLFSFCFRSPFRALLSLFRGGEATVCGYLQVQRRHLAAKGGGGAFACLLACVPASGSNECGGKCGRAIGPRGIGRVNGVGSRCRAVSAMVCGGGQVKGRSGKIPGFGAAECQRIVLIAHGKGQISGGPCGGLPGDWG